jgi:hypothetical protein
VSVGAIGHGEAGHHVTFTWLLTMNGSKILDKKAQLNRQLDIVYAPTYWKIVVSHRTFVLFCGILSSMKVVDVVTNLFFKKGG